MAARGEAAAETLPRPLRRGEVRSWGSGDSCGGGGAFAAFAAAGRELRPLFLLATIVAVFSNQIGVSASI